MEFNPNETPVKIINEGAFGGTYFRDIETFIDVLTENSIEIHGRNSLN